MASIMFIPKAKGKIGMLMMVGCVSLSITCEKCEPLFLCVDIKPKASSLFHGTCTCKKCELIFILYVDVTPKHPGFFMVVDVFAQSITTCMPSSHSI